MAAHLHLAEDAFALHLLLQHLKGLVDVVVTNENLHSVYLFDRAIAGTDAKALGPLAHGHARFGGQWRPGSVDIEFRLPPAHAGCQLRETRTSVIAFFWQLFRRVITRL